MQSFRGLWVYSWIPDRANKQDGILRNDGQLAAQIMQTNGFDVHSVYHDGAG